MVLSTLTAISPVDGRYFGKTEPLRLIFSEFGLIFQRVLVEIHWLQSLADHPDVSEIQPLSIAAKQILQNIITDFSFDDALKIKELEKTTNHDVKAVEYFLKEKCSSHAELTAIIEFIHFACTSEDINNVAYALMQQKAREEVILPNLSELLEILSDRSIQYADMAMLSHTHGQAASPTTVGKELSNFAYRLHKQIGNFQQIKITAKMNGAVGNYNAHCSAYPEVDWLTHSQQVIQQLGLNWNPYTTQIEPHDYIAELSQAMIRINSILIDFARDIWGYIALGYFKQKAVAHEIGSSTMPHKINPIDFENAEGNLALANALFGFFSQQLTTSRWQRDLTDSTLLRNIGTAYAHSLIAYQSLVKGCEKLEVNTYALEQDLADNWQVLAEAIQTVMRRYGIAEPYETLKTFTRGKPIDRQKLTEFIQLLSLPESVKQQLLALTPANYTGLASILAKSIKKNL